MYLQFLEMYFTSSSVTLSCSVLNPNRTKQKAVDSLYHNAADFLALVIGNMNGERS